MNNEPTTPLISLIVVTYNSAALLPNFFAALATTTYAPYEVLVVDNASQDGTPQLVAADYPAARLLANRENRGFGRACNQGARAARGELLVFLNPDVFVTPGWLTILVRRVAEHPDAAIICPTTLYPDQPAPIATTSVEEAAAVPGCAMLMPRVAWQALGGFDERIFLYGRYRAVLARLAAGLACAGRSGGAGLPRAAAAAGGAGMPSRSKTAITHT